MLIPGYHAAIQSIPAGPEMVHEVWLAQGRTGKRASTILDLAQRHGIQVRHKSRAELDKALPGISHQGIVVVVRDFQYVDLEVALKRAHKAEVNPIFVAADHMTDEGNLASIIRTSAFFGASGIIIPKDRSAGVSPRVLKRAVGCHLYVNISRVVNLPRTLESLDKHGYWIIGAAAGANKSVYEYDWSGPIVLVVGNEEKGLGQGVRKKCHDLVGIPSPRGVDSLNVGVATGIILAELVRVRGSGVK